MPTQPPILGKHGKAQTRRQYDSLRGSASSRGYDRRWQAFRKAYISEVVAADPFCQDCRDPFSSTSEIELHHEKKVSEHPEMKLVRDNIRHLCQPCHAKRTKRGE